MDRPDAVINFSSSLIGGTFCAGVQFLIIDLHILFLFCLE